RRARLRARGALRQLYARGGRTGGIGLGPVADAAGAGSASRGAPAQPHHPPGRADRGRPAPAGTRAPGAGRHRRGARRPGRGARRINSSRVACGLLITPHLAEFQARYPGITLELVLDDGLSDLVAGGFDAGIRLGENLARDMVAVRISRNQRMVTAGSPAYFRQCGNPPRQPAELAAHACIGTRFETRGTLYRWEYRQPDGQLLEVDVPHRIVTNDFALMVQAALDGLGLIHVLEDPIAAHLASGALQPVLESWAADFPGFYLYYPHRTQMAPKLRVFVDFLRERLATPPGKPD